MYLLDLTLPTPAENLALDEALLDAAEAGAITDDVLRLWEPNEGCFVVLGRSSQAGVEANLDECRRRSAPVLRRSSGGAAIVTGSGCLMYGVVLAYQRHPALRMLDQAHRHVLAQVSAAIRWLGIDVQQQGTSDLAWNGRKVSGNSLRCKRDHLLYHGTLLYNFNLPLVGQLLGPPPRQPEYRAARPHGEFLANLPASSSELRRALAQSFAASEPLADWPQALTADLVASRYSRDQWNLQR
jgi:lipoate-protein ligase A